MKFPPILNGYVLRGQDNPIINKVRKVVLHFRRLMKEKEGDKLAEWCDKVINDTEENIKGFAKGILNDFQAVYQGFISSWSNGPVEGQVNRLKNIKKCMVEPVLNCLGSEW